MIKLEDIFPTPSNKIKIKIRKIFANETPVELLIEGGVAAPRVLECSRVKNKKNKCYYFLTQIFKKNSPAIPF